MFLYLLISFGAVVILSYLCLEVHYFLRTLLSVVWARLFKEKVSVLQETTVKGICLTSDIDTFLYHMNNARFIRELDFARADFYERTGLFRHIRSKGGSIALGASTIRYRRFVRLFSLYMITSKVIYWDDQGIYMEHRFVTPKDNFVNAIAICKTRLLNCSVEEVMNEMLSATGINGVESGIKLKPPIPPELQRWNESNAISSAILKNAYPVTNGTTTVVNVNGSNGIDKKAANTISRFEPLESVSLNGGATNIELSNGAVLSTKM